MTETTATATQTAGRRPPALALLLLGLLLALAVGAAGVGAEAPSFIPGDGPGADVAPPPPAPDCAADGAADGAEEEAFARTELFFGTAKPDGTAVTPAQWAAFLDREVTPRFPDGLTVMTGLGQFQGEDDEIVQERSMLLILLYPRAFAAESGAEIEEIRAAYETAFQQESVLRSDDNLPVCVSF